MPITQNRRRVLAGLSALMTGLIVPLADALRFYTLRMQETGMVKSNPQQIIADGADWRFLDEFKRELKI